MISFNRNNNIACETFRKLISFNMVAGPNFTNSRDDRDVWTALLISFSQIKTLELKFTFTWKLHGKWEKHQKLILSFLMHFFFYCFQ